MAVQFLFEVSESFTAGETLKGTLHVNVTKVVPALELEVSFTGEEFASVSRCDSLRGRHIGSFKDKDPFFHELIDEPRVHSMSNRTANALIEGSYNVVNFSIPLPASLPPSTVVSNDNDRGMIQYHLRAQLKGSDCKSSYCSTQVVQIRAAPMLISREILPHTVRPRCQKVRSSYFRVGQVFTGAQAKNTLVMPGEQIEIDLAVANESRNSIGNLRVVLRERVRWSAEARSKTVLTNLVALCLPNPAQKVQGVEKKIRRDRKLHLIEDQLIKGENLISFSLPPIPKDARDSYVGSRLCVHHEVIITLESKYWKKNPEVRIPVRIVSNPEAAVVVTTTDHVKNETMIPFAQPEQPLPIEGYC